jgi:putative PIN family toxin of toxin-antitoxin system
MNVVLDANIFISALITEDGNPARILSHWRNGDIDVVVSPAMIEEVRRVTAYPRLLNRYRLIRESCADLIAALSEIAIVVEPTETLSVVQPYQRYRSGRLG